LKTLGIDAYNFDRNVNNPLTLQETPNCTLKASQNIINVIASARAHEMTRP